MYTTIPFSMSFTISILYYTNLLTESQSEVYLHFISFSIRIINAKMPIPVAKWLFNYHHAEHSEAGLLLITVQYTIHCNL